jgi:hypothetical protein
VVVVVEPVVEGVVVVVVVLDVAGPELSSSMTVEPVGTDLGFCVAW